ncbi:MAG: EAL domain-containing protein, partial [Thermoleophilia bacterium]
RRELEAQLERRAFHDPLTGLANRALFQDRIQHALDRASRQPDACLAVVFIDLDDFKAVNDGMGHSAGDELLVEVGNRLRTCVRPADTVARLGGDEFALLLEDLPSPEQARLLAERAIELLRMPLHVMDVDLAVPSSAGVAAYTPGSTVESLLRDADIAMYAAKAAGKCQAAMFDEHLRELAQQRLALRVALPEALRLGQLRLIYQPIQDLAGRELRGFEALLRWDHPERGEISPADFIPDAEESGLIIEIGRWVLHEACAQAKAWNDRAGRPLTINVNVSGVQLRHPEFLHEVQQALGDTGLPPECLTLEITESVLIEHGQDTSILDRLRDMGIGLALDDFGTGYSSLAYLQRFPVTSVKIDRAFISELTRNGDDTLVRSVVAIAEALSLTTVAEGVESDSQLDTLHALDCGLAQGFFVGRPQNAADIDTLIDTVASVPPAAA